jgi:transposase
MPIQQQMPEDIAQLDIEALRALLLAERSTVQMLQQKLHNRDAEIERLTLLIAKLRRMQFGRSSEKLDRQIEQMELKLEELQADRAAQEPSANTAIEDRLTDGKEKKPSRKPLPEHLPRDVHTHSPQDTSCPQCQGKLNYLGEDVSEMLDYVPGHFKVIRHVRPKYSCACCSHIVQAAAPSRPIARGLYAPGLIAQLLVSKYAYHIPLYRQAQMHENDGVELESATMSDAVGGASTLLAPLIEALRRYVFDTCKLHADDIPVPVLAPGKGTTQTARLWVYVRDNRAAADMAPAAVWFAYSPNRKGEHPQGHLKDFAGVL